MIKLKITAQDFKALQMCKTKNDKPGSYNIFYIDAKKDKIVSTNGESCLILNKEIEGQRNYRIGFNLKLSAKEKNIEIIVKGNTGKVNTLDVNNNILESYEAEVSTRVFDYERIIPKCDKTYNNFITFKPDVLSEISKIYKKKFVEVNFYNKTFTVQLTENALFVFMGYSKE